MKANAAPLLDIFEKKIRLEVPLFQRQYVWSLEHQWEPLWEDISRKFNEYLEGRKDAPVHFLGAMVVDQKQVPITHVEKRQVIDGQQRLTTLQIFIAAFRDFCRQEGSDELAKECDAFTLNKGMMADPQVDRFKMWPTQADRAQFSDVMLARSRTALENMHPLVRQKWAREPDPRPRMVEAYLFFYKQLADFVQELKAVKPELSNDGLGLCLEECFQALKNALQVVVIDLEPGDDAQVIFETLNARGEPLLPADLLRNFIFLRAARLGEPQESLYEEYWQKFDDPFWRQEIRQGRLSRPRSDLFMQHFLASRQMVDVPVRHLFVEYKFWIAKSQPFKSVREELSTLSRQGEDFRKLVAPKKGDPLYDLAVFLNCFDISTSYPLLLFLLNDGVSEAEWKKITVILESYFVRRSVCSLSSKNYTRILLGLIRALHRDGATAANLHKQLSELKGESSEWPNDQSFRTCWESRNAYQTLNNPKMVYVLKRLNDSYLTTKHEHITVDCPLTVEHIMPQEWIPNWPLPDDSQGLNWKELSSATAGDPVAEATARRNAFVQSFGNLTIITQALNSAASNAGWANKKPELLNSSLLPINQQLQCMSEWNEDAIVARGNQLFERALKIWPSSPKTLE